MDVALPDFNGVELTRRLKAIPRFAAIPVVMITGHSERQVLEASLKAGAVDFLGEAVRPRDPAAEARSPPRPVRRAFEARPAAGRIRVDA